MIWGYYLWSDYFGLAHRANNFLVASLSSPCKLVDGQVSVTDFSLPDESHYEQHE